MKKHLYEIKRLDIPAYLKWWFIKYRNAGTLSEVLENLTSPITLLDSLRRKFKIFEIGGNSEQETFTGVQAFDYENSAILGMTKIADGYNVEGTSAWKSGNVTVLGLKPNTNYTFYCLFKQNNVQNTIQVSIREQENGTRLKDIAKSSINGYILGSFTTSESGNLIIHLYSNLSENTVASDCDFTNILITEGIYTIDNIPSYEPYTGGQPAPNPNYECPIQNVTGNVEVKVENKNLLPIPDGTYSQGNYSVTFKNGVGTPNFETISEIFTLRINIPEFTLKAGTYTFNSFRNTSYPYFNLRKGSQVIANTAYDDKGKKTFILNEDKSIDNITIYYGSTASNYKELTLQLEKREGTDAFVPHEEQTVTFPLAEGQVLHEGDTIEDKIVQKRKTLVLDGTENWYGYKGADSQYSYRVFAVANIQGLATNSNILSNYFINNKSIITNANGNAIACISSNNLYISIDKSLIADTLPEAFKTYLANLYANGTPVTVEYELAEPIEIPFTSSQEQAKAQIDNLYSYKGTTHISSDNEVSPLFKIQYVKEE